MNETVVIAGIFLMSLFVFGSIAAAIVMAGPSNKMIKRRIDRFRDRFMPGAERSRSIMLGQQESSGLENMLGALVPNPDVFRKRLKQTGRDIPIGRYVAISAGVGVASTAISVVLMDTPFFLALLGGIAAGFGLPHMAVSRMIKKRQKKFLALFPEAIDLIVRGLKSGLPINETISIVATEVGAPVGTEFAVITDQIRFGKTLDEAMWDAADRLDFPDFKFFVISLAIQRETGGNLAETLGNLANILRSRHQMKLKINALSSEGKASAMIIGVLPFIMFGIIYAMNPDYAGTFFVDPRAQAVLIGALLWMSLGGLIIKKMINFEI